MPSAERTDAHSRANEGTLHRTALYCALIHHDDGATSNTPCFPTVENNNKIQRRIKYDHASRITHLVVELLLEVDFRSHQCGESCCCHGCKHGDARELHDDDDERGEVGQEPNANGNVCAQEDMNDERNKQRLKWWLLGFSARRRPMTVLVSTWRMQFPTE